LSGKLKEGRRKGEGSANTCNREDGEEQDYEGGTFVIGQQGKSRDGARHKHGKSQGQDWIANTHGRFAAPTGLYRCVWKCNKAPASLDAVSRASATVRLKLGVTAGPCR
jgi:hypothetical protein